MILRSIIRTATACSRLSSTAIIPASRRTISLPQLAVQAWTVPNHNSIQQRRLYSAQKSQADEIIEEIQEQYATARDEFEIAVEETEKKTVYAADDRQAAADELAKLKDLYDSAIKDSPEDVSKEIQSRVGQRIRELDQAVQGLEKSAIED